MRKLKFWIKSFFTNLYLGILNFVLYPILLLLLPSRIPARVVQLEGDLVYLFSRRLRAKVIKTLREKLPPGKSDEELKRIARDFFRIQTSYHYYSLFLAAFRLKWLPRYVTFEGGEHLEGSFKEQKGAILLSFHLNHPPVTAVFMGYMGINMCGYAVHPWDLNVPLTTKVNTWLCYKGTERKGAKYPYINRGAREVRMRILKENGIFGALLDVAVPGRGKDLKPFNLLGETALFPSGITKIIHDTSAPVHIAYCVRDTRDWRRARVVVLPRLPMTGDADKDMQAIVSANEAVVLEHPEQWWGWGKFERATLAYHEEYRRRKEERERGGDGAKG